MASYDIAILVLFLSFQHTKGKRKNSIYEQAAVVNG